MSRDVRFGPFGSKVEGGGVQGFLLALFSIPCVGVQHLSLVCGDRSWVGLILFLWRFNVGAGQPARQGACALVKVAP